MITPADMRTRYPEFASETDYTDARIQTWIDKAVGELNDVEWGDMYDEGLLAYTAHYLAWSTYTALQGGTLGSIGPVSSRSIGDVSVSFAGLGGDISQGEAFWRASPYGQEYWRLVMLLGAGMQAI